MNTKRNFVASLSLEVSLPNIIVVIKSILKKYSINNCTANRDHSLKSKETRVVACSLTPAGIVDLIPHTVMSL